MKRYLFLLAWIDGSDSASGEPTMVHHQTDLLRQFNAGNEYVFAVEIHAADEKLARAFGYKEAFFNSYTAYDTLSGIVELDPQDFLKNLIKIIKIDTVNGMTTESVEYN